MRIDKVYIANFKNLFDFSIDLEQAALCTVLLGQNATGKSNFIEALVHIFRDLDLYENRNVDLEFAFDITYHCKDNLITIVGDPNGTSRYKFEVNGRRIYKDEFYAKRKEHLPRYVFAYYSGISDRLSEHFDIHQLLFYNELLSGNDEPLRPLFYARMIHSHFVLMSFYYKTEKKIRAFLEEHLGIIGLESILFVLKEPHWFSKDKKWEARMKSLGGDEKFWYARGKVKDFLNDLYSVSLAPISNVGKVRIDWLRNNEAQNQLYLYVSNQEKLNDLAAIYKRNTDFFKMLESTYISDLIQEVRIKVQKKNINGYITFKELSEGEQQLLTVLGLLRFTKSEESLFLLDEPDTHLNPTWKWEYLSMIDNVVEKEESSQIIMTTHDPLVIGGLTKQEIRIFEYDIGTKSIKAGMPDFDPKGLGVAGILTSSLFGLPTTLDKETQALLNERNSLFNLKSERKLNSAEEKRLNELNSHIQSLGITRTFRDPLYSRFVQAIGQREEFQKPNLTSDELDQQNKLALEILDELIKEQDDNPKTSNE